MLLSQPSRSCFKVKTFLLSPSARRGLFVHDRGQLVRLSAAVIRTVVAMLFTLGGATLADTGSAAQSAAPSGPRIPSAQIFSLPMQFEKNAGQTDGQVQFLSRGPGYTVFLTSTQAVLSLRSTKDSPAPAGAGSPQAQRRRSSEAGLADLQMNLLGSNPSPEIEGVDELPGKTSYFIGGDPQKWRAGLPTFARVR